MERKREAEIAQRKRDEKRNPEAAEAGGDRG
jgi:hypothetical protein